jgi:hypothetical protein
MCLFDSELPFFFRRSWKLFGVYGLASWGLLLEMKTLLECIGEYDAVPKPFFSFLVFVSS